MDEISTIFSLNNVPGHISYILIAISYWLTDMFWLRVMAIVGLGMEIVYFTLSGGDLRAGIGWDLVFISINAYQLYFLVRDRLTLRLPPEDRDLLRRALTGLQDTQIARLLSAGEFTELPGGKVLTIENQPLSELYFLCSGRVNVKVGGRSIAKLEEGKFVGEAAFLTAKPATASVVAETGVRAIVFKTDKLAKLFKEEAEVAGLVYQLLGRELAHKMKVSNELIPAMGPSPEPCPAQGAPARSTFERKPSRHKKKRR